MQVKKIYTRKFGNYVGGQAKRRALNYLMLDLYKTIGDGDMENGGLGSHWRCAREVYDVLAKFKVYSYADCAWWLENRGKYIVACSEKWVAA